MACPLMLWTGRAERGSGRRAAAHCPHCPLPTAQTAHAHGFAKHCMEGLPSGGMVEQWARDASREAGSGGLTPTRRASCWHGVHGHAPLLSGAHGVWGLDTSPLPAPLSRTDHPPSLPPPSLAPHTPARHSIRPCMALQARGAGRGGGRGAHARGCVRARRLRRATGVRRAAARATPLQRSSVLNVPSAQQRVEEAARTGPCIGPRHHHESRAAAGKRETPPSSRVLFSSAKGKMNHCKRK
jgi:hypothetical protein